MAKAKKADSTPFTTGDISKPIPADAADHTDISWLDEGYIDPDEHAVDPGLAKIPGRFADLPIDSLVPNAWNPNEQDPKEFDMLVRRMREVGMIAPVQVVPTTDASGKEVYTIIGGEHRWRAAQTLGYQTIPAVILMDERFRSEDVQKLVTMQLNMISGKLNPEKFLKLYKDMRGRYEDKALADMMGFTKQHAFKLMTKGVAEGLPEEIRDEFKERSKGMSDPKQLNNLLTELMGKYGNDLRYNFMIITTEGREHIWLKLTDENHALVTSVLDTCRMRAVDVNLVIEEAFTAAQAKFMAG